MRLGCGSFTYILYPDRGREGHANAEKGGSLMALADKMGLHVHVQGF